MKKSWKQALLQILSQESIAEREPMKQHTTFRAGGPAAYFVEPETKEQIVALLQLAKEYEMPYMVLGNGSNVLFSDKGYEGMIIHISNKMNEITLSGNRMIVGAGTKMIAIGKAALEAGLAGFEPLSGIPGTLGGAVVMNAGAYGGEIKDVLVSATIIDHEENCRVLTKQELELGYRTSIVARNGYIVVEAELEFQPGDKDEIKARMNQYATARKEKQPLEYPSAGSTFKRPEGYFAGKLIQDAGLRGYQVGDAQVSEKHCGFVINRGEATAQDIYQLMMDVSEKVKEQFGVVLEPEVKLIGDFS